MKYQEMVKLLEDTKDGLLVQVEEGSPYLEDASGQYKDASWFEYLSEYHIDEIYDFIEEKPELKQRMEQTELDETYAFCILFKDVGYDVEEGGWGFNGYDPGCSWIELKEYQVLEYDNEN